VPEREVYQVDEAWIETAIESYQRLERLAADFPRALARVEVTVHSPDGLVTVVVGADGVVRDVQISDDARDRSPRELAGSVRAAVAAAGDAAGWARQRLYRETFGTFGDLAGRTSGTLGEAARPMSGTIGDLATRNSGELANPAADPMPVPRSR
jgi:DNA-binding protein YbaB